MDRVLVTGGQGFLGRHVVDAALDGGAGAVLAVGRSIRDDHCYTHDLAWQGRRLRAPTPVELRARLQDHRFEYRRVDVRDADAVAEVVGDFSPDVVIHTAAALRGSSWSELSESNLDATMGTLTGVAKVSSCRFVVVSSGSVYGIGGGQPVFREDGPVEPVDLYGVSKRAAEDVARVVSRDLGLPIVVARVFNLVGAGLQDRHLPAVLAAGVAAAARLAEDECVLEVAPLDATRDFIDVKDAASALWLLANRESVPSPVNIGSGVETPVRRLLDVLLALSGISNLRVLEEQTAYSGIPRACADVTRLAALGFTPRHTLRETLARMLRYFDDFPLTAPHC